MSKQVSASKSQWANEENLRIHALKKYQVLDSLPEQEYDNLTLLARQICDTPVALITLVDYERQWFKSQQGMNLQETPRSVSFCTHAIKCPQELMIVTDARLDERFCDNPLVKGDAGVVFYAGAPLVNPQGMALGTICVIDHQPRSLGEDQKRALQVLAAQVVNLLEWRKENAQLKQLTEVLQKSNDELRQAGHAISHDLKQPISSIEGILRLLKEELTEVEIPDAEEMIRLGLQSTANFQLLLDDLLKYLREGNVQRKKRKLSLYNCFRKAKASLRAQISASGAKVITESELPVVMGHSLEMQRLFQNLISNSIKFSRPQVPPRIELRSKEYKKHWLITVTDNGIGIAPQHRQKVFGIFRRLHSSNQYEGTGMGLALCKKIVLNHGGKIWLKSTEGVGTTFYIRLPKVLY